MPKIHLLDELVAAQIAAGEVIERPVSVVKELVENALDAGAKKIDVDIEKGGMSLIRVIDDGGGMAKEDLGLAFRRHATSKISAFKDLYALHSFGFRGEALASMVAVSQVKATSGQSTQDPAWSYTPKTEVEGDFQKVAPMKGTIMEVRNLFYNVPARRKFVRTNSHETSRIAHIIGMAALAYPEVTFNLRVDGEPYFQTTNLHQVQDRMVLLYGDHIRDHLLHVERRELHPGVFLEAWISDATIHRSNKKDLSTFVNYRYVESPELEKIILEAYYSYIPEGKFPVAHLRLDLPPETIDVNIHPQKTSIQIQGLIRFHANLIDALKDTLWEAKVSVPLKRDSLLFEKILQREEKRPLHDHSFDVPTQQDPFVWSGSSSKMKEALPLLKDDLSDIGSLEAREVEPSYGRNLPSEEISSSFIPKNQVSFDRTSADQADLRHLEPIGQLHATFILAENEEGLFIIDQHTCHERILYDRLKKNALAKDGVMQTLLLPERIELTPLQEDLLFSHTLLLRDLGFIFERIGHGKVALLALPPALSQIGDFQSLVNEMLVHLENKHSLTLSDILDALLATSSCKQAVKAHGVLSLEEMRALLRDLSLTDHPHTCPHGRPTVMSVTMKSLYKYFQRGSYDPKTRN